MHKLNVSADLYANRLKLFIIQIGEKSRSQCDFPKLLQQIEIHMNLYYIVLPTINPSPQTN